MPHRCFYLDDPVCRDHAHSLHIQVFTFLFLTDLRVFTGFSVASVTASTLDERWPNEAGVEDGSAA